MGAWHGRRDGAVCPHCEQAFRHALLHRLSRRHRHRAGLHAHHHSDGLCLDSGDGLGVACAILGVVLAYFGSKLQPQEDAEIEAK